MPFITTTDGTEIFYKDWGPKDAQPIVFHHGWPLSADDWDNQLMFFLGQGYRVIAHDRRGHGRSTPDRHRQRHGHLCRGREGAGARRSTSGTRSTSAIRPAAARSTRYVARAEPGRVVEGGSHRRSAAVMLKSDANPGGTPIEVFDGYRAGVAGNRAQIYLDIAVGPVLRLQPHRACCRSKA